MSVSTHSIPCEAFILTAYQAEKDIIFNINQQDMLYDIVHTFYPIKELLGCYKGKFEDSLLIKDIPEDEVFNLACKFNQACYVKLTNHKHGLYNAYFVDIHPETTDTCVKHMGYLRSIPKEVTEALNLDYSYDLSTDTYFTIWPTDTTTMQQFDQEIDFACEHGLEALKSIQ